jgi:catalytic LigB subunit of aromatic ring-opening dioxygenase
MTTCRRLHPARVQWSKQDGGMRVGRDRGGFWRAAHTDVPGAGCARGTQSETAQLFANVADHLRPVQPDVLVIFDSDHLNTFFLDNFPSMSIGVADRTTGPNDGTPELPRYTVPVSDALGSHLFASGMQHGFDLARSQEFEVDHSILVPLHFLTPKMHIPIVPVFINGIVPPLPAARRCYALGQMVRVAVESVPDHTRVAVLGSGSFSLDVGGPLSPRGAYSGVPDTAWANSIVGYMRNAKTDDLLNAPPATAWRVPATSRASCYGHAYGVWRWD